MTQDQQVADAVQMIDSILGEDDGEEQDDDGDDDDDDDTVEAANKAEEEGEQATAADEQQDATGEEGDCPSADRLPRRDDSPPRCVCMYICRPR